MPYGKYGQNETLISSIRNIIKDYPFQSIFKEFLQNADDAGATRFHVMVDTRSHPTNSLFTDEMKVWQGPAILIFNNAKFKKSDFDSLMQIRVGGKQDDDTKIGKHGLGFNSCYHFTDVPSFISGDSFAFLDPQVKFLHERGIRGNIPKNGIDMFPEKDQLIPFEGIEGVSFQSTFEGTLFRLPFRKEPSEISSSIYTAEEILKLFYEIKSIALSQFLFLRNIEKIEVSQISAPLKKISLWEAAILNLDENERTKRKRIDNDKNQIFQIKIKLIDKKNDKQLEDHWIVINGAQQNPEDSQLKAYAKQYRLRILGGIAAPLNSENTHIGRMYSFFSLPDATQLPVHLNGAWAQSSDRGKLLLETDNLPDLDHQKLNWNRHILFNFLPKLYCNLLEEIIKLHKNGKIDLEIHPISKFWPFSSSSSSPKYIIGYGFKVLKLILQNDEIFQLINGNENENDRVDILFKFLPHNQIIKLAHIVQYHQDALRLGWNPDIKLLIRSLPIWQELPDPTQRCLEPALKPASCGHILPKNFKYYRTKINSKIYLKSDDDYTRAALINLDVPQRDIHLYTFEDVEFPSECDNQYLDFLTNIISDGRIIQGLKTKRCFPTLTAKKLKKIDQIYDHSNDVFRIVFNGNSDMFIHANLSKYTKTLSNIGLKDKINQQTFIDCAKYIESLQKKMEPVADIRYRGFTLINHFYKHIDSIENFEESMMRYKVVPIAKDLGKPYNIKDYHVIHPRTQVLDYFSNIILPIYKEVAWSQVSLIAEDVVPPSKVLQKYPSLGKPEPDTVIEHLRFLCGTLRNDDEWKENWAGVLKNNVYDVYKWLEKECTDNEDFYLSEHINENEPLFLNFNINKDPFNANNWVSATDLVLNSEPDEEGYVNLALSKYPTMLKSAGAREIQRPDVEIKVRPHRQLLINNDTTIEFLLDQEFSLNDVTFVVNGENIRASRYMLAVSSTFFRKKFATTVSKKVPTIDVQDIEPNSMRILLRYLYGQNIDEAIKNLYDIDHSKVTLYKDLLKLADNYTLDHLKELMELRLSRLVTRSNVEDLKRSAETSKANRLKEFCDRYTHLNIGR